MAKKKTYQVTKPMHHPAHPGEVLKGLVMEPLGLSVSAAAQYLDVDRTTLSRLIHGHIAVSVEMAIRLSKAVENTTPQWWLNMQHHYDLAETRKRGVDFSRVRPFNTDGSFSPA